MLIHTASEGISFARGLENAAAEFYEAIAARFEDLREVAQAVAEEDRKFSRHVQRVYQEVITDAIEASYCLNLETTDYKLPIETLEISSAHSALGIALELEEVIVRYYSDAHEQAGILLADITRALGLIVRKRKERIDSLQRLRDELGLGDEAGHGT